MIQSVNQIDLYKKIDDDLMQRAGIHFSSIELTYSNKTDEKEILINVNENELTSIYVNEEDSMWSPSENELRFLQNLTIKDPSILFGEEGVTCNENIIGIAAHIHSKESGFQKTVDFGAIRNLEESRNIQIDYYFPPSSIRGIVNLDFFFYVKEVNNTKSFFANKSGMLLSNENLNSIELVVDGSGSSFPMTEFEDKDGPLWKIEKNWIDAEEDIFEVSNVNISLNTKHKLFPELKKETRVINRALMMNIMIQAMSLITQQVILIERHNVEEEDGVASGTILSAVLYWISTFDIDTSDMFSIQNSFMNNIETQTIEGENND
jgi:hypothetical protein